MKQGSKLVVLFGEGETAVATAACLRRFAVASIADGSEPKLAYHSRFVQHRYRVSGDVASSVLACLEELRGRYPEPFALVPTSDFWIERLAGMHDRLIACGNFLPHLPEMLALTLNKLAFAQRLPEAGLPIPGIYRERVTEDWSPTRYPFVLKPDSTFRLEEVAGVKAMIVRGEEEWRSLDKTLLRGNGFMAQELVEGACLSACFCTTSRAELAVGYVTEKVHFSVLRTGSRVRTVDRPDVLALCAQFVERTGFVGYGELEFLDSPRGPLFLELNARPWSQVLLSLSLDRPIMDYAVGLLFGEEQPPQTPAPVKPATWIHGLNDLRFRLSKRRAGIELPPDPGGERIYALSLLRDPVPAAVATWRQILSLRKR